MSLTEEIPSMKSENSCTVFPMEWATTNTEHRVQSEKIILEILSLDQLKTERAYIFFPVM
jgi:hypothetical protein